MSDLRKLAEEGLANPWRKGETNFKHFHCLAAFEQAATPDAILTLFGQIGELRAELAKLKQQEPETEPMFWVRICSDGLYEGPIHNARIEKVRKECGGWKPLYLAAGAQPDTKELAETMASRIEFAKYIARVSPLGSSDWACGRCHPESDILKDGFVCVVHKAIDATKAAT